MRLNRTSPLCLPRTVAVAAALLLTIAAMLLAGPHPAAAAPHATVTPAAGAGTPDIASQPVANATVTRSPGQIALAAGAEIVPAASRVTVYGSDARPVATGPVHRAADGGALVAAVPPLKAGVYTVVWRLAGPTAAPRQGSFAFAVDPSGASPALVRQPQPDDELTPVAQAIPRWLAFAAIMIFIGAFALRLLVTVPAVERLAEEQRVSMRPRTDRLLLLVAGAAIVVFVPATLAQLVNEANDDDTLSFWQAIKPGAIGDVLTGTPDGHLWLVRLGLTAVAALVTIPAAVGALRRGWEYRRPRVDRVVVIGLTAAVAELLVRVIPSKAPPAWPREIFTALLDWGHMLSAAIWVGGLVALAVLGLFLRQPADRRGRFWPISLRRFSLVATVCVGAMILTGLWTAWLHLGPPRLLFHTLYGETLLVKLILVLILVGLGALNQLWLLPRVNAIRERGEEGSALAIALRHFRRVIVAEAVIGLLILLVVPFLSGSARNQEFQAKAADLTQTQAIGGQPVRLRPSGAQPGMTDYDVWAPDAGGRVTVAFASPKLGVPETDVLATSLGGDHYRVSGFYTPVVGAWQARVANAHGSTRPFALAVTAAPVDPGKAPPPTVRGSTWAWGIAEVLIVLLALGGAGFTTRWLTRRRGGDAPAPAAAEGGA